MIVTELFARFDHMNIEAEPPPKLPKYQKNTAFTKLFRKVHANFCLLPCDTSQEPDGNCSEKLAHMNFFILDDFFRWIFLCENKDTKFQNYGKLL